MAEHGRCGRCGRYLKAKDVQNAGSFVVEDYVTYCDNPTHSRTLDHAKA